MKTAVNGEDAAGVVTYNASRVALPAHYGSAPRGWVPAVLLPTALVVGATRVMGALGMAWLGPSTAHLSVTDAALNLCAALLIGSVPTLFE